MNNKEKVDYYYNFMLRCARNYTEIRDIKSLSYNNQPIKKLLYKIIEDNNEYLLTQDYLRVLVYCNAGFDFRKTIYDGLASIASNDHQKIIKEMCGHYQFVTSRAICSSKMQYAKMMMKKEDKDLIYLYNFYRDYIFKDDNKFYDRTTLSSAIFKILVNCIVDNEKEHFKEYCDCIIKNEVRFVEFLELHGVQIAKMNEFFEFYPIKDIVEHLRSKIIEKKRGNNE